MSNAVVTILNMAATGSTPASEKHRQAVAQLSQRLQQCWSLDLKWDLYPQGLKEVSTKLQLTVQMLNGLPMWS